jgi:hypothetical protein
MLMSATAAGGATATSPNPIVRGADVASRSFSFVNDTVEVISIVMRVNKRQCMSLRNVMLDQLAIGRRVVADGSEVVPAWRIGCEDGDWLILTRFDPDKPAQRDRAIAIVKRFMVWKLARSFILTAETGIGRIEAVIAIGASRSERLGVMQAIIRRNGGVQFGPMQWPTPEQMDPLYWTLLPRREESLTAEEAAELQLMVGEAGEFPAWKL